MDALTILQQQIISLVAKDLTKKGIASQLNLSGFTIGSGKSLRDGESGLHLRLRRARINECNSLQLSRHGGETVIFLARLWNGYVLVLTRRHVPESEPHAVALILSLRVGFDGSVAVALGERSRRPYMILRTKGEGGNKLTSPDACIS